jgi:F0F1-type ATP synthase membrane subunit b/b'
MSKKILSKDTFLKIANVIIDPKKSYYSSFPEFLPLEFEHFCTYLLEVLDYQILSNNDSIEADGGVDFVAQKNNIVIIGQCKKSDWSSKIIGGNGSNISEPTVKQHYATTILSKTKYPKQDLIGYFMTLRKFSAPCRNTFAKEPLIKLIDFFELRKLIISALQIVDSDNKQITLVNNGEVNIWYDVEIDGIQQEISLLEKLVSDIELDIEQEQNKSHQAQKWIMEELIDLYREIDLIKAQIKFLLEQQAQKSKDNIDEDLTKEFAQEQDKINQEYDELEDEYVALPNKVLDESDLTEAKNLYRELSHLYHPDKHQANQAEFTIIFQAINQSKSNLAALRDIRDNPHKYFGGKIPASIQSNKKQMVEYLTSLQAKLAQIQTKIENIKESENHTLYELYYNDRLEFDAIVTKKKAQLQKELSELQSQLATFEPI